MKTCYTLLVAMLFSLVSNAQEFEWAYLIDNVNANEVAGLDTDDSGNVYMCGVYGDDSSLPYDGTAYLTKTDADGTVLWTKYLGDELVIGDIVCAGDNVFIAVQSTTDIQCNGAVFAGAPAGAFMALIVLDQNDGNGFVNYYPENHGQFANLDADGEVVVLQCAGQFNGGEFVIFFDSSGNELVYHELDIDANINDIAYHDGNTYLTGHTNFPQSVVIDNVNLPAGEIDGLTFVLGFDENFTAQWGYADDALNAQDGQVVADASGVYSYQTTLDAGFQITPFIWKLDVNGNLVDSVVAPTFTSAVTVYPDMAISDCHVLLMASNAFNNNSHELTIFDHDLNVIDEKQINGNSNLYSGQVATFENQIYVSHVHMDELDFNGEVEITDDLDDAFQYPYLAKVGVGEDCGSTGDGECSIDNISYEYLSCVEGQFSIHLEFDYEEVADSFLVFGEGGPFGPFAYNQPFYSVGPFESGSENNFELIIFDSGFESCSAVFLLPGVDCAIGDCGIFDLEVFDEFCDSDSTFSFQFNAEIIDPGNDFLEVWVNGESYGNFEIDELPIQIGGVIPVDIEWQYLEVCVNDQPDCCTSLDFLAPECGIGDCGIFDLEVFDEFCDSDSTFSFQFNAEIIDPGNDFLEVWVNGESYGNFEIEDLPIQLGGVIPYDIEWQILEICVNDQPDCCTELAFIAPFCADTVNCVIGEVEYEIWDCIDGEFFVDIWFDSFNTTESFDVYGGGGVLYGNFDYGEEFYTIGPFPSGEDVIYGMTISDSGLDACVRNFEIEGIDCAIGDCEIFEFEVFDQEANDDGTYSMYVNADIYNPGNEFFDVWINDDFIGFYAIADLPIQFISISPSNIAYDNILICVNDNDSCCSTLNYLRPAGPDGLEEFSESFTIYPNPIEDILHIELSSNSTIQSLMIFDLDGRLLMQSLNLESRRVDVSTLAKGVYFLVVEDGQGNQLTRRLVK